MYVSNTFNINEDRTNEWLMWMKQSFIPEIQKNEIVKNIIFTKVLVEEEMGGNTFSFLIQVPDMDALEAFEQTYSNNYLPMMTAKFEGSFVTFRTYLEEV